MRDVIVFDHPYTAAACDNTPHHRAFSAAICKSVMDKLEAAGDQVGLIDLHADGFDPVMSEQDLANWRLGVPMNQQVAHYQDMLKHADRIVFVFPVWWELMPAMTKGFLDKVYAKNVMYTQDGARMGRKLSADVQVTVITVMGTPNGVYRFLLGKPVVNALRRGTFKKTGLKRFKWINYSGVDRKSPEERARLIEQAHV